MRVNQESLLYCAYAIAVFDLLCGVLFAVFSLTKIHNHLSWLTIFGVCFGLFWLGLIIVLIFGIYQRKSELVRYWLIFSSVGIFVEICLIMYAFLSHSTFQSGVAKNFSILCIGLIVETIFAFIIYQFYLAVAKCNACGKNFQVPRCTCQERVQSQSQPKSKPSPKPKTKTDPAPPKRSSRSYKCNILQTKGPNSLYTCGPINSSYSKSGKTEEQQKK
ncbi:uncharacterized protein LOC116805881 [Drosophila grimshawi]|uniref:uncharacterized protein LOC116805881 n=1 Tax=Drosophila grimshawi TaxID=7222 RepID=UPI000C870BFA|nr:uncharacterized protein LOC116805881 [Drosophila grimshawi]